jgi:amidase
MACSVSDAAYVLSIIAGKDENDNYTRAQPWDAPPDYTQALNFSSLRGARIGIPRNGFTQGPTDQPIFDAFDAAIQILKNAGATIVDNANFSAWDEVVTDDDAIRGNGTIVLEADFISNLASYLSQLTSNPNNIRSLSDESNFTHHTAPEEYPNRNTAVWDQSLSLGYNNSDSRFWEAYQYSFSFGGEGGVLGALKAHNLDALVLPTDYSPGVPARAGLPIITVPMGFYPSNTTVMESRRGLVTVGPNIPLVISLFLRVLILRTFGTSRAFYSILTAVRFGLSFLGAPWSEETLIGFAYAFEQRTHSRRKVKPFLKPSTQLADVIGT